MFRKLPSGFTVVELLVVIVIIGILASIAIITYPRFQNDAHDVAIQTDIKQAYGSVVQYFLKNRSYPTQSYQLDDASILVTQGSYSTKYEYNFVYCPPFPYSEGREFAFIAASKSDKVFVYKEDGISEYKGSWTMDDYADICVDVLDTNGVFDGDFDGPDIYVTCSGYAKSLGSGGWRKWAGGSNSSICY